MRFDLISLFPAMFQSLEREGVVARALAQGLAQLHYWNPRDYAQLPHRRVDDRPYGGGPGMVMQVEPLRKAIRAARRAAPASPVVYLSPQGQTLTQRDMQRIARGKGWILIAGRYEGIDERLTADIDEEWSIGDYVLSGGELPAMVILDAVIRLLPGALGHRDSARLDSHSEGMLDHPQYTRPPKIDGQSVPEVLLSGDHQAIARWRRKQALGRTWLRRPDLLQNCTLTQEDQRLLAEFIQAHTEQKQE